MYRQETYLLYTFSQKKKKKKKRYTINGCWFKYNLTAFQQHVYPKVSPPLGNVLTNLVRHIVTPTPSRGWLIILVRHLPTPSQPYTIYGKKCWVRYGHSGSKRTNLSILRIDKFRIDKLVLLLPFFKLINCMSFSLFPWIFSSVTLLGNGPLNPFPWLLYAFNCLIVFFR